VGLPDQLWDDPRSHGGRQVAGDDAHFRPAQHGDGLYTVRGALNLLYWVRPVSHGSFSERALLRFLLYPPTVDLYRGDPAGHSQPAYPVRGHVRDLLPFT